MITIAHGNLLQADTDALVNTVNTVGVMGKGIALQFKKAYPDMFENYQKLAKNGSIRPGRMHVWETGHMTGPKYVVNFPTKAHWRSESKLEYIRTGLADLVDVIRQNRINSIAIPPLGCGNGGLDWNVVEPVIRDAFTDLPDVTVHLYPPEGAPNASVMVNATPRPKMTVGRAALVGIIGRYTERALESPALIESQKLMYFLQEAGQDLRLNFSANRYGPYADNLRHVMVMVEGHFLSGYGDGSAKVLDADPLIVLPGAKEASEEVLNECPVTFERIEKVLDLAEGFESAYGLELLATIHWLCLKAGIRDENELLSSVREWSPRKARMFTERHIRLAYETLLAKGWLAGAEFQHSCSV